MAGLQHSEQVVERRADVAHVDLDVREGGSAEREHDVARAGCVGDAVGERQRSISVDSLEQLLSTGLSKGHAAVAHCAEPGGVVVDADHRQAAIGEGQCQRQPDAAEADDGHIGGALRGVHRGHEVSGARAILSCAHTRVNRLSCACCGGARGTGQAKPTMKRGL